MSQLLQNAAYGTAMIFAVALLRRVLKDRLVPEARLALWAVCLFRLLTPAAPESVFSLWGLSRLFEPPAQAAPTPAPNVTGYLPAPNTVVPAAPQPAAPTISWETVLALLWLAVGVALAARYALCWTRTRRAVSCAIPVAQTDERYAALPKCARLREGAMEGAPLTFGAVRPTVVLSPGLEGETLDCVLAHEGVHAARRDNLWHYVTALALAVHWWNPAVWLMSRLLRRDIELSCDRATVRKLGAERRAEYAQALVSLATQSEGPAFCHTFGRKAAEERILSVMKFKKMTVMGVVFSLALVLALTAAFASEPKDPVDDTVEFHGQTFSRSELSQETLDWLDWYLDLSEEEQLAVNYVPADLRIDWNRETNDAIPYEDFKFSSTKFFPNPEKTKEIQCDWPEVDPDDVDLSKMKENLSKQIADSTLTQEEADAMLANTEQMLEQAKRGELKLFMSTDSTGGEWAYGMGIFSSRDGEEQPVFSDPFGVMAPMYYQDSNGNFIHLDPEPPVFVEDGDPVYVNTDPPIVESGEPGVTPALTLDEFLEGLAQRVKDGRLTQAEADQRVASLLDLMNLKSLDEITDRSVLRITVHEEDFTTGGYAAFGPFTGGDVGYVPETGDDFKEFEYDNDSGNFVPVPSAAPDGATAQPLVNTAPSASCGVEGCTETRYHAHNEGHCFLLNTPCPVEGCTITGNHIHGDVCYSCNGAGHSGGHCDGSCYTYNSGTTGTGYPVCTVNGCTLTGHHTHNGVTYCGGANHHGGTCYGTCGYSAQQTAPNTPSTTTTSGHHGNGHHGDRHH